MNLAQPAIYVAWPAAPLTSSLVHTSITGLGLSTSILSVIPSPPPPSLIQWASYDCIDHALTASDPNNVLSSSYTIRKALIRKHFLARCMQSYLVKRPESSLAKAVPLTCDIDIAYADELDEMWSDELWDLGRTLDANSGDIKRWFILKPGMADRGMGIRLFDSKDALYNIFQEFDYDPDEEEADEATTSVMTSQLRHFVLQEYISTPLLIDPNEVPLSTKAQPPYELRGHKFHLRTYVVASGALTVFMYERILALFSSEPYHIPMRSDLELTVSLTPHLTNTSLQTHHGEECVCLLDELIGCRILSGGEESSNNVLNAVDVAVIKQQVADTLSETFRAALDQPPLPNAFELYGADFLVSHESVGFQVKLLEINSEPAIELTGPRLTWILEDLFKAIGIVCIQPFARRINHEGNHVSLKPGETLHNLRKCLDIKVPWRAE
ncbi:tubulin-tyrosine ligase family-domain-containing protein [Lanmaoa asiatica]|nr:tubulin-tyrosine ligase family-domain-containing protein [Lanmaoa asiatica]